MIRALLMGIDREIYPSFSEFRRLAAKGNLIPIYREILADLETPVSAFMKVSAGEQSGFLLESVEHGEKIGRYSFIGCRPSVIVEARKDQDVLSEIEARMKDVRLVHNDALPGFCGGFVGYLAYENVGFYEKLRLRQKKSLDLPQGFFFLADRMIIFDQIERTLKIVALCHTGQGVQRAYRKGIKAIQEISAALNKPVRRDFEITRKLERGSRTRLVSNMTRSEFEQKVQRVKKYIRQGDCIQVVLSQRFDLGRVDNQFDVYRALRASNPSPYMFFFKHGDFSLIGSSPELLVKKTGRVAELRPIAGTRKRGASEEEDALLERNLKKSVKELAEHLMLVDLGRNDLGRLCRYDSVKVKDYARTERYSHVMHLVSEVVGQLKPGKDSFELLRATFPAGTVSGAPKIRAMQIIDELENDSRGPYAGALGYFSFNGDMDMCIMIRTIVVHKGRASVQAGAGIVFDSNPAKEYQETVNKAKALFEAVEIARVSRHAARHR